MDAKTFRRKLIRDGFSKGASLVLAAATVLFLILGAFYLQGNHDDAVDLTAHKDDAGTYAYFDVVAFEEWVCKSGDETYYVLYDQAGDVYLSVISDGTMRQMIRQEAEAKDYMHFFDDSYRLYGMVKRVKGNVMSLVEEVYHLDGKEYVTYFGRCYFDTTESPTSNTAWMWLTFAIFTGIFALVFGIVWIGQERPYNRETREYTGEEFDEAARLLEGADKKQKLILGETLLIHRGAGMLVRYSDILWVHLVDVYVNGVRTGKMVRIHTRNKNSFKVAPKVKDAAEELNGMMEAIQEKNPEVLVGYTPENKAAYNAMIGR